MKLKNQNKDNYRVWRIDPATRAIAMLLLDARTKDFGVDVQRMCRASTLGHVFLGDVPGGALHVAGDADAPKGQGGFRFAAFPEAEATSGIGVLFGTGPKGGLFTCPVDRAWIDENIVWTDAAETDGPEEDDGDE